jgi:hypothetical protein
MIVSPKSLSFSIVVVGSMNPAIHHPLWYRHVELLDEQEKNEAIDGQSALLLPSPTPMAQFNTLAFQINCQSNRWQILTTNAEYSNRILSLTETLFDKILPHTPVTQLGFNFDFVFDNEQLGTARALGRLVCRIPLALGVDDPISGEWRVAEQRDNATMTLVIKSGADGKSVIIATNYTFLHPAKEFEIFVLADNFKYNYGKHLVESERRACSIAEQLYAQRD